MDEICGLTDNTISLVASKGLSDTPDECYETSSPPENSYE